MHRGQGEEGQEAPQAHSQIVTRLSFIESRDCEPDRGWLVGDLEASTLPQFHGVRDEVDSTMQVDVVCLIRQLTLGIGHLPTYLINQARSLVFLYC